MTPRWRSKVTISESRRQVDPILDHFGLQNGSVEYILDHFGSRHGEKRVAQTGWSHFGSFWVPKWMGVFHFGSFWIPGGCQEVPRRLPGEFPETPGEPRRGPGGPRGGLERCLDSALGSQGRALAFERVKGRARLAFWRALERENVHFLMGFCKIRNTEGNKWRFFPLRVHRIFDALV